MNVFSKIGFFSLLLFLPAQAAENNLISNGDFEKLEAGKPADWIIYPAGSGQRVEITTEKINSGKQAICFITENPGSGKTGISSPFIAVKEKTEYLISFWVKPEKVESEKVGAFGEIVFYDEQQKRIKQRELLNMRGDRDWMNISQTFTAPEKTASLKVNFSLHVGATGRMYVDNIILDISRGSRAVNNIFNATSDKIDNRPVIFPAPRQAEYSGKKLADLGTTAAVYLDSFFVDFPGQHLEDFLKSSGISVKKCSRNEIDNYSGLRIYLVSAIPDFIRDKAVKFSIPQHDQGYFLYTGSLPNAGKILVIGAQTGHGLFYGLQTFKQLTSGKEKNIQISEALISDYPALAIRGMVQGVQWFRFWQENRGQKETQIERAARLKLNSLLLPGSWLDSAFQTQFRLPLSAEQIKTVKLLIADCQDKFINLNFCLGPTWPADYIAKTMKNKYPDRAGFDYLDEEEFVKLFKRLDEMYNLGMRSVSFNFDDLRYANQHVLHDPRHKEKFKNIGRAHVYLVTRCYEYLRKKNQPVSISMVPLVYTDPLRADDEGKIYLQELKELPAGVKIIIVETKKESLDYFKILTGRYPVLWSNFLAHYENTKALVFPPFSDGGREIDKLCHGYYFLPVMPLKEDFRGMSWLCAADYLWQPAEYNPEISFQKASSLMFSASIGGILKEFSDYKNRVFSTATQPNYPVYGNTKTEKIDYCRKVMADFLQFRNKIKNAEFGNLAENLIQEINTYQTQWELIIKEIEYRDFPCQAASFTPVLAGRDEEKNIISKSSQIQDLWLVKTMNPPNAKTAFYLSYDSSNIYITAFCSEPAVDKIIAVKTEKDSEVFSDDCIEIFLGPKAAVFMPYYHFAVNSLGIVFDEEVRSGAAELDQPDTKIMEKKWNAEAKTAAWKWSGGWAVQIKIPVKDMGVQLITSGLRWRFNVGRVRYGAQKEFSALAYLPAGQFHTPERFAILEFK